MGRSSIQMFDVLVIGIVFMVCSIPSGAFAEGYKLFKNEEFIQKTAPDPKKTYREEILTVKDGANELGGIVVVIHPAPPGKKPSYHYHKKRESILVVIQGEGTEFVEGKAIPIKTGDIIFLAPNFKHTIINNSTKDLKIMEFFTHPPVRADVVRVK